MVLVVAAVEAEVEVDEVVVAAAVVGAATTVVDMAVVPGEDTVAGEEDMEAEAEDATGGELRSSVSVIRLILQ